MHNDIFQHTDYKRFLNEMIFSMPQRGRGEKSRLARKLNCNAAFVTQVLSGNADFSMEQGALICDHFGLSPQQTDMFLLLIQHARSGTDQLRRYFDKKIAAAKKDQLNLQERLHFHEMLPEQIQTTYYSYWHFPAVHVALTIPNLDTSAKIASYLNLPIPTVNRVLEFLTDAKLAEERNGKYKSKDVSVHLGAESPFAARSHSNWRQQALFSLEHPSQDDFHYSSIVSLSRRDLASIRANMIEAIEKIRAQVKKSPSEDLCCYTMDLFSVGNR